MKDSPTTSPWDVTTRLVQVDRRLPITLDLNGANWVKSQGFEFQIEICLLPQTALDLDLDVHVRLCTHCSCLPQDRLKSGPVIQCGKCTKSEVHCCVRTLYQQPPASGVKAAVHFILFFVFSIFKFSASFFFWCATQDFIQHVCVFLTVHTVTEQERWRCLAEVTECVSKTFGNVWSFGTSGLSAIFNICYMSPSGTSRDVAVLF